MKAGVIVAVGYFLTVVIFGLPMGGDTGPGTFAALWALTLAQLGCAGWAMVLSLRQSREDRRGLFVGVLAGLLGFVAFSRIWMLS